MVVQILSAIESFTTHLTIIARLQRLFWNILGIHRSHDHIEGSGTFYRVQWLLFMVDLRWQGVNKQTKKWKTTVLLG